MAEFMPARFSPEGVPHRGKIDGSVWERALRRCTWRTPSMVVLRGGAECGFSPASLPRRGKIDAMCRPGGLGSRTTRTATMVVLPGGAGRDFRLRACLGVGKLMLCAASGHCEGVHNVHRARLCSRAVQSAIFAAEDHWWERTEGVFIIRQLSSMVLLPLPHSPL